jgi:hypothetical protein
MARRENRNATTRAAPLKNGARHDDEQTQSAQRDENEADGIGHGSEKANGRKAKFALNCDALVENGVDGVKLL